MVRFVVVMLVMEKGVFSSECDLSVLVLDWFCRCCVFLFVVGVEMVMVGNWLVLLLLVVVVVLLVVDCVSISVGVLVNVMLMNIGWRVWDMVLGWVCRDDWSKGFFFIFILFNMNDNSFYLFYGI